MKHFVCKSTLLALAVLLSSGAAISYADTQESFQQTVTFSERVSDNGKQSSSTFSMDSTQGGNVNFSAAHQKLVTDFYGKNVKTIQIAIQDQSQWIGSINPDNAVIYTKVTLDKTSTWECTADSYVTILNDADLSLKNITSTKTIYYNSKTLENQWLQGKTFPLNGGGKVTPMK